MKKKHEFILAFNQIDIGDVPLVGGKNASLGEMYQNLTHKGVKVPNGFAVTASAYRYFLKEAGIQDKIKETLKDLDTGNIQNLSERGHKVRELIKTAEFPEALSIAIKHAYQTLCTQYGTLTDVAVRSSATAEDLPDASFAGQQETYLNIKGEIQLLESCKKCFASLFTNRAISYRVDKGFDHFKVALSIGVQKMVRSDLASAGVIFTLDTESGFQDVVFITGAYGLGENVVQGAVNPDSYYVFKPTLRLGKQPILRKTIGDKKIKMIYSDEGNSPTKNVVVSKTERKKFVIENHEIITLAKWACIIEEHYSEKANHHKPMDIEWAKDGNTNELFIVQARPETVQSQKSATVLEQYHLKEKGKLLVQGQAVGEKIGAGSVNVIRDVHNIAHFREKEVLITDMTDPDWEPIMKKASAIITNRGGRTCFSADTIILTNEGFMTFEETFERGYKNLKVPSLNRNTLKIEWKKIQAIMKQKSPLIQINCSQTGKMKENFLKLTPDHKMLNIHRANLVDTQIKDMLSNEECVLLAQYIPSLKSSTQKENYLAYLLGGIMTDGHIYLRKTHGEVTFIQKPTEAKKEFISQMNNCLNKSYGKEFKETIKKPSEGFIRGEKVIGIANAYRCYSKSIAQELMHEKTVITQQLLNSDNSLSYHFLAGVIDGDGSFNNGRVNVYISKKELLEPVIIACLRIGIVPQVTVNRNIYNVQIVENLDNIGKYTKRVKCKDTRKVGTRFFNTKQLFKEKLDSNINNRVRKNLLIDEKRLSNLLKELKNKESKKKIISLLNSDLRQIRTGFVKKLGIKDVYNISIEDNHNYIVFTERYSPILVNNCHAAIISRELGIPCIVGTNNATEILNNVKEVTASCSEGEKGNVYQGILKFKIEKTNLKKIPKTKTKIMMNLANPEMAFEKSFIPNQGVGLAREEFIINDYIKVHPLALLNFDQIEDRDAKEKINELTFNYPDKKQFFIEKLAEGVATIAAAFYPKDVIVRLSDFKSNEYANLIGGKQFEPTEDNPMIGWRGASRYYSKKYKPAFALECAALKKVRDEMGLINVKIMIPFCRTIEEGKKVLKEMESQGLKKGKNNLEVYVMCEIPSNVILADEFSKIFDGFSIGSNDLTQLTLGLDRDSELVASIYDENNEGVKRLIKHVIDTAKKNKRKIGICGQAPSDFPEFAAFLVDCGIDSISLNPDTVIKTTLRIAEEEEKLKRRK